MDDHSLARLDALIADLEELNEPDNRPIDEILAEMIGDDTAPIPAHMPQSVHAPLRPRRLRLTHRRPVARRAARRAPRRHRARRAATRAPSSSDGPPAPPVDGGGL